MGEQSKSQSSHLGTTHDSTPPWKNSRRENAPSPNIDEHTHPYGNNWRESAHQRSRGGAVNESMLLYWRPEVNAPVRQSSTSQHFRGGMIWTMNHAPNPKGCPRGTTSQTYLVWGGRLLALKPGGIAQVGLAQALCTSLKHR